MDTEYQYYQIEFYWGAKEDIFKKVRARSVEEALQKAFQLVKYQGHEDEVITCLKITEEVEYNKQLKLKGNK